jgi:hypothetical protein
MDQEEAITRFRAAAIAKGDFAQRAARDHQFYRQMVEAWRFLYEEAPKGREAFRALLADDSAHVRCWIAGQLLSEGDANAAPVLEAIVRAGGPLGFDAEMTLEQWRKGRLGSPFGSSDV